MVRAMSEPSGLNPLHDANRDGWVLRMTSGTVLEGLLQLDPVSYAVKPLLAERWEESADSLRTTFHLRPGVHFHDGATLSSSDVVAVLEAVTNPQLRTAQQRGDLADLASYRAIDPLTVEVTWKRPSPLGLRQFAKLPIFPASSLKGNFDSLALVRAPIGTGPFRFERWTSGTSLSLRRNETYWGEPAWLDRVEFRFAREHTLAAERFRNGEFDLMTQLQPAMWRAMEGHELPWAGASYNRSLTVDNSFSFLAWNNARPLFADVRVRRALAMLYPAGKVFTDVDLGLERPTTCPYYLGGQGCDPTVARLQNDAAEARLLLRDAGWRDHGVDGIIDREGVAFHFTVLVLHSSVRWGKIAALYREALAQVGIEMEIERVESAVLGERVQRRDFDAVFRSWTEFDEEQDLSALFHSRERQVGANLTGYSRPEVDALLDQVRAEPDANLRAGLRRQIHRLLYADQPCLFLSERQTLDVAKKRVHGLHPSLLWYDLHRTWLDPLN